MVDLVAGSSITIHRPLYGGCLSKENTCRGVSALMSPFPSIEFLGMKISVGASSGGICVSPCSEPTVGTSSMSPIWALTMALVSTCPRKTVDIAIRSIGIGGYFSAVVAAEDVHRGKPNPEMFIYTAQLLQFIPERCIVFGNSNLTVEATCDAQMKGAGVASNHPGQPIRW